MKVIIFGASGGIGKYAVSYETEAKSLEKLGLTYIDLMLLRCPQPWARPAWLEKQYIDLLRYKTHVLDVLTEKAGNSYKAFLRKPGISYAIAGTDTLDYVLAMQKPKELFGIETLMLGGGAALSRSFIQAGMCDEVNVVVPTRILWNRGDEKQIAGIGRRTSLGFFLFITVSLVCDL